MLTDTKKKIREAMDIKELNRKMITAVMDEDVIGIINIVQDYGLGYVPEWNQGYTLLGKALTRGRRVSVRELIRLGAKIDEADQKNSTVPLCRALGREMMEEAWLLIHRGARLDADNDDSGNRPIHELIIDRDFGSRRVRVTSRRMLYHMIRQGVDLSAKNREGQAAIHLAAKQGIWDLFNVLLEEGSTINLEDDNGRTALFYAVEGRQKGKVDKLLRMGAGVNHTDNQGMTPLMMVLNKRVDYVHAMRNDWSSEYTTLVNIVKILLTFGAKMNQRTTEEGITALHMAAHRGYEEITRMLLINGADINAKTKRGRYVPQFSKYHREVADMPRDYDPGIPKNTWNHATRGQVQVCDLIKCWLLKLRAGGKEIAEELKSEIACVEEKYEEYETIVLNEIEIMKSVSTTRQSITLFDVWRASEKQMSIYCRCAEFGSILEEKLRHTDYFKEELREKVKRALRRKKMTDTVKEELEKVKFLRHLQGHELDRVMSYLEIEDLVKIMDPKNISTTEEE
ncbi:putative ankyrin repeat protein RF_0381 [Cotesia glomerata]|uniref:putative ankyrin repeat protein RF_0381 n=1 Tax=Cotesia glomerata TaxID=32391 RepID=UPI001D022D52|nr:putative ankyrin repeat protein RF_0381 [Cotesia glomerata]